MVDLSSLSAKERAAPADVGFYESGELRPGSYETLGPVEGISCQVTRFERSPTRENALNALRARVASLGGDGVVQILCSTSGPSYFPACTSSHTCTGTAIRIGKPGERSDTITIGSGFYINRRGDLVTNAHVVKGCKDVTASVGRDAVGGVVIRRDEKMDLALIRTDRPPPAMVELRVAPVRLAESVIAVGFPLQDLLANEVHVTDGSVSALAGFRDDTSTLQFSAPIQPGNSGGPLLDAAGDLVGINTAILRATQNVNFAIKAASLVAFLDAAGAEYSIAPARAPLAKTEVAARATRFTAGIRCLAAAAPAS